MGPDQAGRKWENIRGVSRKSVAVDLIGCTHGGQRMIEERLKHRMQE